MRIALSARFGPFVILRYGAFAAAIGVNVSRVAGLGYLGMLAGPAVVGPVTTFVPLHLTFFLPAAFRVVVDGVGGLSLPGPD